MRELRAVLVRVPPLLADLIKRVVAPRLEPSGVKLLILAEIGDLAEAGGRLDDLVPDLVIVGKVGATRLPASLVQASCRVLALSADLTSILGPGPDAAAALTPESLAARLLNLP